MQPKSASLEFLARFARASQDGILCFAGSPVPKAAPAGVQEILRLRRQNSIGPTIGLTQTKNAAAFKVPSFQTTTSHQRVGATVQHFATVLRTTSADATHESYYPAAGLHQKPTQGGGQREFWEITEEFSELIREGEQEHLNDARRAYEITYKCIENEINQLAGRQFGPASTPHAAEAMALAELTKRLPLQLGTNSAKWVATLDRLLLMTKLRDTNLWHSIETESIREEGGRVIEKLRPSTFFRVGQVPSSSVVNL